MTVNPIYHWNDLASLSQQLSRQQVAISLGNFDGVHLGHQALISKTKKWSQAHNGAFVLITFFPHPSEVLNPKEPKKAIFESETQESLIQLWGVDHLVKIHFSEEIKNLEAEEFFNRYILEPFKPNFLCVGHDFAFGKNRQGTIAWLAHKTRLNKIKFEVQSPVVYQDLPISSSRIREALSLGKMEVVRDLLGFPYFIRGEVLRGHQRGRRLGFPTINQELHSQSLLMNGVYVSKARIHDHEYFSVTNVGNAPTFDRDVRKAETHVLGFSEDVYDAVVEVALLHKIRNEQKFESADELKKQIQKDILLAREFFKLP